MLVLTRKKNESICIGENIVLKVIRIGKSTVKLGIEAPIAIRIIRTEITDEIVTNTKNDPNAFSEKRKKNKTKDEAA